jgi:hypothetical protein
MLYIQLYRTFMPGLPTLCLQQKLFDCSYLNVVVKARCRYLYGSRLIKSGYNYCYSENDLIFLSFSRYYLLFLPLIIADFVY